MRRLVLATCVAVTAFMAEARAATDVRLAQARSSSGAVAQLLADAFRPNSTSPFRDLVARESLGGKLTAYAALPAGDSARCESLVDAARRILAGGTTTKRTPDETIFALDELADKIFAAADAVEAEARTTRTATATLESELAGLRAAAHVARFHARRIVAAMHYNLFKRGLRLAELVAATYAEKDAVAAWRELTTLPAPRAVLEARRAELKKLEASYKELEDQCCPPDEAIMREKIWQPQRAAPPDRN